MRRLLALIVLLITIPASLPAALPSVGSEAPVMRAVTYDGKAVSTTSLKGKVVALIFVAEWCPHCREELPALSETWKKLGLEVEDVIGIVMMVSSSESKALDFYKSVDPPSNWKLVLHGEDTAVDFGVAVVPTAIIIDKNWTVVGVFVGKQSPEIVLEPIIKLSPSSYSPSVYLVHAAAMLLVVLAIAVIYYYGRGRSKGK